MLNRDVLLRYSYLMTVLIVLVAFDGFGQVLTESDIHLYKDVIFRTVDGIDLNVT